MYVAVLSLLNQMQNCCIAGTKKRGRRKGHGVWKYVFCCMFSQFVTNSLKGEDTQLKNTKPKNNNHKTNHGQKGFLWWEPIGWYPCWVGCFVSGGRARLVRLGASSSPATAHLKVTVCHGSYTGHCRLGQSFGPELRFRRAWDAPVLLLAHVWILSPAFLSPHSPLQGSFSFLVNMPTSLGGVWAKWNLACHGLRYQEILCGKPWGLFFVLVCSMAAPQQEWALQSTSSFSWCFTQLHDLNCCILLPEVVVFLAFLGKLLL